MYDEIRQHLTRRRDEILDRKSATVAALIDDVPDRKGDSIDISTDEQLEATQLRLETRYAAELGEIDAALHRIADGEYGECEECGDVIPVGRLKIHPLARTCVECQETVEHQAKLRRKRPGLLDEFSE